MQLKIYRNATTSVPSASIDSDWGTILTDYFSDVEAKETPARPGTDEYDKFKISLPAFSFASFVEGANSRAKRNMKEVYAAVLDIDNMPAEAFWGLVTHLRQYTSLVYSSPSHIDPEKPKARIVVPLAEPVPAEDWPRFWKGLDKLVEEVSGGYKIDPSCKDASRIYFFPYCSQHNEDQKFHLVSEGPRLDPQVLLSTKRDLLSTKRDLLSTPSREKVAKIDYLEQRIGYLEKNDKGNKLLPYLQAIVAGEAVVDANGDRHHAWLEALGYLIGAGVYHDCSEESVWEIILPSIHASARLKDENTSEYEQEILKTLKGAYDKVDRDEWQVGIPRLTKQGQTWSKQKFLQLAQDAGYSPEEYLRRALLSKNKYYYVRGYDGVYYKNAIHESDMSSVMRDVVQPMLAEVAPQGVFFSIDRKTGQVKPTPLPAQLERLRTNIAKIEYDWSGDGSSLRKEKASLGEVLRISIRANDGVDPEHQLEVEEWLKLFAGEKYERLVKWICLAPQLSKPLIALMLRGPRHTGKSLFIELLSRTFGYDGVVDADLFSKNWVPLDASPLVFAEEGLPSVWQGPNGLKRLKAFITQRSHNLEIRYQPNVNVLGCYRVVLTANDNDAFRLGKGELTANSAAAIAERFLVVDTPEASSEYLRKFDPDEFFEKAQQHFKWILDNATPDLQLREGRLGIVCQSDEVLDMLDTSNYGVNSIADWLANFIDTPSRVLTDKTALQGLKVDKETGTFYLSAKLFTDEDVVGYYANRVWSWTSQRAAAYMKQLSRSEKSVLKRIGKKPTRVYEVPFERIVNATDLFDEPDEVLKFLTRDGGLADMIEEARDKPADVFKLK